MTDEQITEGIAARLRSDGFAAWAENTGGWIYCVLIPHSDVSIWYWGMANEAWGGSLLTIDGENPANLQTDIPSDSIDIQAIVDAISQAMLSQTETH